MKLSIDHQSPMPLHAQVETLLRELICQREYQEGKALPKEEFLSKTLGISRNTVRQAIGKLVYENLVERKRRKGTFVKPPSMATDSSNFKSLTQETHDSGVLFESLHTHAILVEADAEVACALEIEPGSRVVRVNRLKGIDGVPMVLFVSHFHPRVGISTDEDFTQPLYDIIEKKYSLAPSLSREHLNAITADTITANQLNVTPGAALLLRRRTVLDTGKKPIEYSMGYYHQDHFTFKIDITSSN
jgi:GntR family transcriptional regulator